MVIEVPPLEAPRLRFGAWKLRINDKIYNVTVDYNQHTNRVVYYLPEDFPREAVKPIFGVENGGDKPRHRKIKLAFLNP